MIVADLFGLNPLDTNGLEIILLASFVLTASSTSLANPVGAGVPSLRAAHATVSSKFCLNAA